MTAPEEGEQRTPIAKVVWYDSRNAWQVRPIAEATEGPLVAPVGTIDLSAADMDGDGDLDIVVGALGIVDQINRAFLDQATAIIKADVAIIFEKETFAGDFLHHNIEEWLPNSRTKLSEVKPAEYLTETTTAIHDVGGNPYVPQPGNVHVSRSPFVRTGGSK